VAARTAGLTALAVALEVATRSVDAAALLGAPALVDAAQATLGAVREGLHRVVTGDPAARRTWQLVDLVATAPRLRWLQIVSSGFDEYVTYEWDRSRPTVL
jgi:hypothetical protein